MIFNRRNARAPSAAVIALLIGSAALAGCNQITGFSSLEEEDNGGPATPISLSAGGHTTCANMSDGSIQCWGAQVGDGSGAMKPRPTRVLGLKSDKAAYIAIGGEHACAIVGGAVFCWGSNDYGQLGDGTFEARLEPVQVAGITDATKISSGNTHTCVETTTNAAFCWGSNGYGELGDGTTRDSAEPVALAGMLASVEKISAGGQHTCAALAGSEDVYCWGRNNHGQLGVAPAMTPGDLSITPIKVAGLTNITRVYAGDSHSCAKAPPDDGLKCWGANEHGQLGDGTQVDSATPVTTQGITGIGSANLAKNHSCASYESPTGFQCWGSNELGQLPYDDLMPMLTPGALLDVKSASTDGSHACLIDPSDRVLCWGLNDSGQLGSGAIGGFRAWKDRVEVPFNR